MSHAHTTCTHPAIYTTSTYVPGSSFPSPPVTNGTAFDVVRGVSLTLCCLSKEEYLCESPLRTSWASDRGIARNTSQMLESRMAMCSRYSNITLIWWKIFTKLQQVHVNLWYKITHLLLVSSEAPLWSLLPPVFMYTHTRKRANGLLRSGGRWDSLRMFSSSSTEYTLWQTDSMKTFSPSQHVARRSVIASSSCRSGVSWSYKRRERVILLVIIHFPHCHSYSHLIE